MIFDDEIPSPPVISIPRPPRPGNNQYPPFWTDERLEQLKAMWAAGDSGGTIARALGNTRNAIIGKASRLHLAARKTSTRWKNPALALKKVNPKQRNSNTKRLRAAMRAYLYEVPSSPPELPDNPISLLQLEPQHCRWPCTGEGIGVVFCGGNAMPGHSYCVRHCRMAYEPPGQRRRAPVKYWSRNGAAV